MLLFHGPICVICNSCTFWLLFILFLFHPTGWASHMMILDPLPPQSCRRPTLPLVQPLTAALWLVLPLCPAWLQGSPHDFFPNPDQISPDETTSDFKTHEFPIPWYFQILIIAISDSVSFTTVLHSNSIWLNLWMKGHLIKMQSLWNYECFLFSFIFLRSMAFGHKNYSTREGSRFSSLTPFYVHMTPPPKFN